MAIGYGLTGKIQGKIGSKVYRVEAGKQIISEYNPGKQDRKSEQQLKQRAIMTEATRISSVFPWECLVGLSLNRSTARRKFVKDICKDVTTRRLDNEWEAAYDMANAKFSDKPSVVYSSKAISIVSPNNTQLISCTMIFPTSVDVKRFQLIVAFCPNELTPPVRSLTSLSTEIDSNGRCNASVQLSNVGSLSTGVCYLYAVPVVPNTLKKKTRYSELLKSDGLNAMETKVYVEFARAEMLMGSIYVGTYDFQ